MRRTSILVGLMAMLALPLEAGTVKEAFGSGILGVPWGASLTAVVGVFPQGDHVFALTPGCRAYWVKDGQTFLGVPRETSGVLFGFDAQDRLVVAAIAFDYARRDELRSALISLLGAPTSIGRRERTRRGSAADHLALGRHRGLPWAPRGVLVGLRPHFEAVEVEPEAAAQFVRVHPEVTLEVVHHLPGLAARVGCEVVLE